MIGQLLAIWQADAAFPSGGFAFSNGMEGLAAGGAALDPDALRRVIATTWSRATCGAKSR
ncbi:hypothetical protein ACIKT0_13990 [Hansschlegelia beijingensis]|uniref:hypothetical protein n=1 Tax=Hansschlegelia beijingensis TaxID=1133344 RepID=UPI00387F1253